MEMANALLFPGIPISMTVSWPERCNVELAARIFYDRVSSAKIIQFTVVSGCHGADALSMQMTQNRDRKSSAFGRIGSAQVRRRVPENRL